MMNWWRVGLWLPGSGSRAGRLASGVAGILLLLSCGCAGTKPLVCPRPFAFPQDTFAFSNELHWVYQTDPATGRTIHQTREPKPTYALHCFALARATREFFFHARFDPALPPADDATCRKLIRQVVACSVRTPSEETERIVIPGYENLRAFSTAREKLLKAECGSMWGSYFQRGNWRMVFPFTRRQQARMARQLADSLRGHRPPIVHLTNFPKLRINHAVVLIAAREDDREIEFTIYDPNNPGQPASLRFDRVLREFHFPANQYYSGGRLHVYEVYRGACY